MHTLVSFLGRGQYRPDGKRSDYRMATYRFEGSGDESEWISMPSKHFAFAAYEHHRHHGSPFDRIVVLGTAGSMWDTLAESFGAVGEDALSDTVFKLSELVDSEQVTQAVLDTYATELSTATQAKIQLQLIPAAIDAVDQSTILTHVTRSIEESDCIYLDVTHGYRHLPMIGLAAAAVATSLRGATIEDIAYGALDMTRDGLTPVVSLKWILQLFRVLNGVNELTRGQHLRPLIECFPQGAVRNKLEKAAFQLDVMRIDDAARSVRDCLKLLSSSFDDLPVELQLVADLLRQRLEQFSRQQRTVQGLTRMAQLALDEDEFLRTAIFLSEAVELAIASDVPGDAVEDGRLKAVRNWLAHAGRLGSKSKDEEIRECITSRSKLRKFFRKHIERLNRDTQLS